MAQVVRLFQKALGLLVLCLTIFGADLVRMASTYMGIAILVTAVAIYAVGMVEMALEQLQDERIVDLDEERKAAMVSNLLVVLCGNKDAQPIVNSGSIY